ncbi:MAG: glycosyltransferase family 4 protein [Acidobacteriota bacterium]
MKGQLVMVDMAVSATSPAGSCVRTILCGLPADIPVSLFSAVWDAAAVAPSVAYHPVPAPQRPVVWRYVVFHTRVARRLAVWLKGQRRGDVLVQATQGQWAGADIVYAHFCHGAYLPELWKQRQWGRARFWLRMLTHAFNAWRERLAFDRAQLIVAPSLGLQRELMRHYGIDASRIEVLANPVDIERFTRPAAFDRQAMRASLGVKADQILLAFMALGDFERKGLGLVLQGLAACAPEQRRRLSLLVIGGQADEIQAFTAQARACGVGDQVQFVGMQQDVRPFLWAADVFAFPSAYEIFSLAILQAAAAGLPVLVSQGLYGAEEFVEPARNGWVAPRSVEGVTVALQDISQLTSERMQALSAGASESVRQYSRETFVQRWLALYRRMGLG